MSFTLSTLKTAIQDYTDNSESTFVTHLPDFIKAAEEKNTQQPFSLKKGPGIEDDSIKQDFDCNANNKHKVKFGVLAIQHTFTPDAMVITYAVFGDNLNRKT